VRKALRAEGIAVRFGIHERGVWVRVTGTSGAYARCARPIAPTGNEGQR
jgi:hypothetical protein